MAQGPYRRPDVFTRKVMQPLFAALGVTPTLTVRGRTTGRSYRFPVLPLDFQGSRYVVAPRGNTQWARNLRVAGEAELKDRRGKRRVRATEIPPAERRPIVDAYVEKYGSFYGGYVKREFEAIPDPANHPVFRLDDV